MQIPIRPFSGQDKPWPSLPRLNWAHPLTRGLLFYGYDTGAGCLLDLVDGDTSTAAGTTPPGNKPSRFGSGLTYAETGGSRVFAADTQINKMLLTARYSLACAWYISALPSAAGVFVSPFGIGDAGTTQQATMMWASGATNDMQWALNNVNPAVFTANSINTFHSSVCANTSATAQNIYLDGGLKTTTALTAAVTTTTAQVTFNANAPASLNVTGVNGKVFFGAIWTRTLTAQEAFILHNDPYCFLIYPEDEIFAQWVGTTGAAFDPAAVGGYNYPWSSIGRRVQIIGAG